MAAIRRPARVDGQEGPPSSAAVRPASPRRTSSAAPGIETTLFEREKSLGGVPRHVIPAFRIADETIEKDIALMERYGVEVRCGAPAPSVAELKAQGYTHILFAIGAWKPVSWASPAMSRVRSSG